MTTLFRTLKARKAKFGFEAHISTSSFIAIGEVVSRARQADPELLFEVDLNFGKGLVKVYTDHESAAFIVGGATYPC